MSREPRGKDMEDTCSEYDNVGSDVEQDCDEVLHLKREGGMDMRYLKQYCPEDGGYVKNIRRKNANEGSGTADQFTATSCQSTERRNGSQPDAKPRKASCPLRSRCTPVAREAGEGEEVGKGLENKLFFCDGDEIEQVLDGARFIEDLEDIEASDQRQGVPYQDNERIRKGRDERDREDNSTITRNYTIPGANRNCESSHMSLKERQGKGRGRRAAGQDIEQITCGVKACTTNKNERVKTSSKENRKAPVRTKAKSSKPHPSPRHSHGQAPIDSQKAQPQREAASVPSPSASCNTQESEPRVVKPSPALCHTPEQEQMPPGKSQSQPQKAQQEEKPSPTVMQEQVPEQPRRPQSPDLPPDDDSSSPKKTQEAASFPSFEDVPGPCEPEDLIDGIIFAANYLGCTQVLSDKNPSKTVRMSQAHEAVSRIKSQDEDSQMMTEVDLFISTKTVKVLNADTQDTMMDSALRTISYIADIGSIVVLMARRRLCQASTEDFAESVESSGEGTSQYGMICYVFESEDAQLIAQSIGQAFSVAYREFLRANGINPTDLSQKQYSDIINSQEMYHDDLIHFSNSDNCKELWVEKQKGENLGVVIVESGWGSILPTVILAGILNSGPAARSGKLSVGDQIMSINDTSLVGLPLATCQGIIKGLKNQLKVKMSIVSCPPVTTVLIKRPDLKFQLGFSVQNGIICSLMRGGIAERGGVRVGHRIIEINGQSVVAMPHEKIVQTLSVSVGEINMKTMPAVMFRLLTGQETPSYI
ncbi:amyloid-beta A4 precursor protein-binding family A member 2 isoform X1 [Hippocampus zosterae]|uniref:amyloid-beta A4 precursor protein-binding family A member 2 isoform X1 n=1 Tax=Hippocampus zosterae TaxID=109293 RepID=UPI00223DA247|nr:amyloid-beta A4 precursor protein-binding family A member 2 isoform X1 [Hippocampus zosterae]XP_051917462.1 amyloid-beta A4 precursor protein-binding family A member 2 isoform X1 [Hippocampus zosterae]